MPEAPLNRCDALVTAFISHAAEDETAALQLRHQLAAQGINSWCFEEDLRHGDHIEGRVKEALTESDCIVIVLSPHALKSSWVCRELGYAIQLRDERGGVPRPCIIPVHTYEDLPQPIELQPLQLDTQEPLGPPIAFHRHRCFRLRDATALPALASSMKPAITRIQDPRGRHARLFEGVGSLMEELFPNELDRPDIDEIRDWLEADLNHPDAQPWPEVLLAAHAGDAVTGYVYMNYSPQYELGYAAFLGISRAWRTHTTMRWLMERGRDEMKKACPQSRGVFFQVDPLDLNECTLVADASLTAQKEMAERLHRINLFQNFGALMLVDDKGIPIRVPQPCLRPPLGPETEIEHFLMVLPSSPGDVPEFGSWMVDEYLSLASAGFGPEGANVPGYSAYLAEFATRLKSRLPATARFTKLYFTREMRAAMRRPRDPDQRATNR